MDFDYSPKVQELRRQVRDFRDNYVVPNLRRYDDEIKDGSVQPAVVDELKDIARADGLWNLCLPNLTDDEPGTRLTNLEYAPLAEIMGRVYWSSEAFNCSAPDSGNMELLQMFATPAQRAQWLIPLMNGEIRSCFAMTEPDQACSDATNVQTLIRRDGDDYVINGRKWFITGAAHPNCKLVIVMGQTNPDASVHTRQSMILVPLDTPGLEILRNMTILNHHSFEGHCELLFKDVRVPAANLLGDEGGGFAMAQARLGPGRIHHCMRSIGQCELALELMIDRAQDRKTFGKFLHDHGPVAEWIAMSRMEIDQARLLVLRAAWLIDVHGKKAARNEVAMIKVVVPRMQTTIADRAIQVFGAMGLNADTPLPFIYTWGRALKFIDGPDEVHLRSIARQIIKDSQHTRGQSAAYMTPPLDR